MRGFTILALDIYYKETYCESMLQHKISFQHIFLKSVHKVGGNGGKGGDVLFTGLAKRSQDLSYIRYDIPLILTHIGKKYWKATKG